jgi:hypothetical protein
MSSPAQKWPLERVLFALAGTVGVTSGLLTLLVSRWFALLALLAGANQWLYALTGSCPASLILRRTCRFDPATPADGNRAAARTTEVTV